MSNNFDSVKKVTLTAGNQGMAGAPVLHLVLLVDQDDGSVTGKGVITQAVAPPGGVQAVSNITGQVRALGFGPATQVLMLKGVIISTLPPPAIGTIEAPFSAYFVTDNDWVGKGGFDYGPRKIADVPVRPSE